MLTTIADASAISGRSLGEMGAIFNKVAANGKIQGEELNQLADSGIPVLQLLSEEMGITAGEVRKLASEGKISFAEFEAAMRSGMGGAAKEMGDSIVGSLQNVGAAVGRLGAAGMSPFVDMGTSAIGDLTDTIDTATKGVELLGKGFEMIPGPVKSMAGAALFAKVAMMGLNSEAGVKLQGNLKKLGAGFVTGASAARKFGTDVAASYQRGAAAATLATKKHREAALAARAAALSTSGGFASADLIMRDFGHTTAATMSAATTHFRGFATAGAGVASSAVKGLGKGLSSLVGFMGGPLGVGIMAGTLLFGQFQQAAARANEAQKAIKESAEGAAEAQEALMYAVAGTTGALTGEGLVKATEVAKNSMTEFIELGKSYQGLIMRFETETNWWERLVPGSEARRIWHEEGRAANEVREAYAALEEQMEALGVSEDELARLIATGGPKFDELIRSLEAMGPAGARAAEELRRLSAENEGLVASGRTVPESMREASEALAVLADSSADAESRMKAMEKAMKALGLLPQDLSMALLEQAQAIEKLGEEAAKIGPIDGLFGADGNLNFDNAQIAPVVDLLGKMRDNLASVAANGGDAAAEMEKWQPVLDTLKAQLELNNDEMDTLLKQAGLMPDQINALMSLQGADKATLKLIEFAAGLNEIPAGKAVEMKIEDEGVIDGLNAIGAKVEGLDNGMYSIALQDTQLKDAMGVLDLLGVKIKELPGGRIDVTDNTPETLANLRAVGLEPKEWNGKLIVEDNAKLTAENVRSTLEGLTTHGKHIVNEERRISYWEEQGYSKQEAKMIQGPVPVTRARGGLVPRLAGGGATHGGYQLPMTGPGTGRTDGILGMSADGQATAWVDRGEYVTNRAATMKYLALLEAINADDQARVAMLAQGVPALAEGGTAGAGSPVSGSGSVTVGVDGTGALGVLGAVGAELGTLGEGANVVVTADVSQAEPQLQSIDGTLTGIEGRKDVSVTADTAQPSTALAGIETTLQDLTGEPNQVDVELDAEGFDTSVTTALAQITDLTGGENTPTIRLDTTPLEDQATVAGETLAGLGEQNPVPVADMDNAPLLGEVAEADGELHRLGDSKATSVADVDNSSALANINNTITELNRMPVERVIKIVAHGSTEGLATGGKVPGLATGGQVEGGYRLPTTGPGTGRVDGFLGIDHAGMPLVRVNAGEWVINDKQSSEYDKELAMINAGTFPKLDDLDKLPGYFKGGVVSPDQLLSFARGATVRGVTPPGSLEGSPYVWGGGLLGNWGDCSGAMSGLAALAVGMEVAGRKFATMNEGPVLASMGFRPGLGPAATSFNIGWFNGGAFGGHTSGTIGGTNVEMGGGRGNGQVGGAAAGASHPQYTNHAWLPLGELVAFDYFSRLAPVLRSRVPAPNGGYSPNGGLGIGMGGFGVGPGGAGVTLHDRGGWLEPGGMAVNMLREPEPVLTPYQWATFESAIKALPGATDGMIQAARSLDGVVEQMTRISDTPTETAKAWHGLAGGDLTAENLIAIGRGRPLMGLGITARMMIGDNAADGIISLAGGGGFAAQASGALEQELMVNIAISEHTIRAAEVLEKAREDEVKAAEKVTQAEEKLRNARDKSGESKEANAKAVQDAEKALAEARGGSGEDKAKRISEAEEKLAEARKKQADGVAGDADDIVKAEEELAEARKGKVAAAARVIEAQTGMQVATVIAALEIVDKVATRIGDTVVGAFEGIASGASMLVESITRLGENMKAVAQMFDAQLESRSAALTAAQNNLTAVERLREAERRMRETREQGYRDTQAAEFNLRMTRYDAAQVVGAAEVDLAEMRKRGIFDVHAVASAGDRAAIKAASDVAVHEARLANVRAEADKNNFDATRAVTQANFELEEAPVSYTHLTLPTTPYV